MTDTTATETYGHRMILVDGECMDCGMALNAAQHAGDEFGMECMFSSR